MKSIKLLAIKGIRTWLEEVDGVITLFFQSCLDKVTDQLGIAAMAIDDEDLFEPVPADLIAGRFEQVPHDPLRQGECPVLVPCLSICPAKVIRKYDCVFFFGGLRPIHVLE